MNLLCNIVTDHVICFIHFQNFLLNSWNLPIDQSPALFRHAVPLIQDALETDLVPGEDLRAREEKRAHSRLQSFVGADLRVLVRQSCIPIPKAKRRDRRRYRQTVSAAPLDRTLEISSRSIDRDWKIRTSPTTSLSAQHRSALPPPQTPGCRSTATVRDLLHRTDAGTPSCALPRSSAA